MTRFRHLRTQLRPLLRELALAGFVRTLAFRHPALRRDRPRRRYLAASQLLATPRGPHEPTEPVARGS